MRGAPPGAEQRKDQQEREHRGPRDGRPVPPERLVLSSDCGFGRQGMSRTHALYKMIAMVRGANMVRRELGLPEGEIAAADPRFRVQQTA